MNAEPDNKIPGPGKPQKGKPNKLARDLSLYSMLIVALPSCVLAGYWIGAALDLYFGTGSLLAMAGLLLGAIVGFYQMYLIIRRQEAGDRRQED